MQQQPVVTAVAVQQPPAIPGPPPCCSRPPEGHPELWYHTCIASITLHSLSLIVYGFFLWAVWLAFFLAVISGSVLICCSRRDRGSFRANTVCQSIAAGFDAIAIILWAVVIAEINDDDFDDDDFESATGVIAFTMVLSISALVSAIACAKGSTTAGNFVHLLPTQQVVIALPPPSTTTQPFYAAGPNGQMVLVQGQAGHAAQPVQLQYQQQGGVGQPFYVHGASQGQQQGGGGQAVYVHGATSQVQQRPQQQQQPPVYAYSEAEAHVPGGGKV